MYRFDGSTVLVINTNLTYTVTLQTSCTLLSGNRRDAAVSQPLLRQPPAEAERVASVEIDAASRVRTRFGATHLFPECERRLLCDGTSDLVAFASAAHFTPAKATRSGPSLSSPPRRAAKCEVRRFGTQAAVRRRE